MQNDFLPKHILPKCFKSFISKISMEASAKENFIKKSDFISILRVYDFIIPYFTEIFNRK